MYHRGAKSIVDALAQADAYDRPQTARYLAHKLAEVGNGRKGRPSRGKLCQQTI
jgi:hypothetical protein